MERVTIRFVYCYLENDISLKLSGEKINLFRDLQTSASFKSSESDKNTIIWLKKRVLSNPIKEQDDVLVPC